MLEDLIVSRVRVKLLELFLSNPGSIFHVRDIVRRVDEEINAVRRELLHMEKCGMVSKEPRANRLFYKFREDYPLYFDLLALINKTKNLGGDILKNKNKIGKIKYAFLSGKFIRNQISAPNEVEMLIVGNVILPQIAQFVRIEESKRSREVNYTVMSEDEFAFRKSRRDPFLQSIIEKPRVMIIGDEEEMLK